VSVLPIKMATCGSNASGGVTNKWPSHQCIASLSILLPLAQYVTVPVSPVAMQTR
jgi:hypothetical protein